MNATLTDREQEILLLAWNLGRDQALAEVADAIEAAAAAPQWLPVPRRWDEQVAARQAIFEECAQRAREELRQYRIRELATDRLLIAAEQKKMRKAGRVIA